MNGGVVDGLNGTLGVSGGLAIIADLGTGYGHAGAIGEGVVPQVSREAYIDPVGILEQLRLLLTRREAAVGEVAWIGEDSGGKALHAFIGEWTAAANAITDAIVERADAKAIKIDLRCIRPDLIIFRVSEVEAFAVEIDLRAIDAVFFRDERLQGLLNMLDIVGEHEAHDVEAEAIDLVVPRVEDERIDDQLLHHLVFTSGIRAARGCL